MSNVSVPVRTDEVFEGSEEFDLRLNVPSSLGPAIQAGSRNTATGIIVDSDGKCITMLDNKTVSTITFDCRANS